MLAELSTLMTFNPVTLTPAQPLLEVVELLNTVEFHHWPVVDAEQRLVGIVSDVDVVRAIQERSVAAEVVGTKGVLQSLEACLVEDIMTRDVQCVPDGTPPRYALQELLRQGFHALPVIDRRRVVGLLTSTDFLREWSYGDQVASREPVTEVMDRITESLESDTNLDEAFLTMQMSGCDFIGIVRGGLPLGVVTRRDVRMSKVRASIHELLGDALSVSGPTRLLDIVASTAVLRPGSQQHSAAVAMIEHNTQAVAVVNQAGRLLGAVSDTALLRAMHVAL